MEKQTIDANQRIKANIQRLVEANQLQSARQLLAQYIEMASGDTDIFSMQAVIEMQEGNLDKAIIVLQKGLKVIPGNFDLLYNLACAYEMQEDYCRTYGLLQQLKQVPQDDDMKNLVVALQKRIESKYPTEPESKAKIAFFVKPQMDSFLGDIIECLKNDYEVKKCVVTETKQIDEGMEWADICWFEWCDELIGYASKINLAFNKKIICRIHGYEVYTDYIVSPNWENVDQLIVVTPHILRLFNQRVAKERLKNTKIDLIYCGVNLKRYPLVEHHCGFNIGYLGYINFKKNIPLTLDVFYELYKKDARYKLYLAGEFQEERTYRYFQFFLKEHKLEKNIFFEGWKNEKEKLEWFKKINYMLISSIDEGLCYAAAEAMSSGVMPILHLCEGLKDHYDKKYLFSTHQEACNMIMTNEYNSREYREFIEKNFSAEREVNSIKKCLVNLGH